MKKAKSVILVLLMCLFVGKFSFSQEKMTLTLDDTIRLALSQNPYHLASGERVQAAKAIVREAAANFFPTLNAQGLHTLDEKVFSLEFPDPITGKPQRITMDFTRDYQFSLSLSLPLFTGGRLISGFKQARYNLFSTEEGERQSENTTVFNAKTGFYGCLIAKEFVKVAEEAVEVAEKHLKNVKSLHEVGMASKFDMLRSEVRVANLKPQLIKARNNLEIAKLGLKTLLGIDLSQSLEIKGELIYEAYEPDLEECLAKALRNRPEVSQLNYQKQMAEETVKLVRAADFPTVALSGTYNFWADKLNFQKDTWQSFYAINLVLNVPIFNGFSASARVAQSKAVIRELELTRKGLEKTVGFEVRRATLNLKEAKESLLSQEKNVEQAQESLRIAELNFSEGLATTLDVSSVQAALSQAKTNYTQALYDYGVSLAQLDKAMGVGGANR